MEFILLEYLGGLGVGCILALVIFFMFRREVTNNRKQMREDRRYMEDRLTGLLEGDQKTRADNTKALTELTTLLVRLNGKPK